MTWLALRSCSYYQCDNENTRADTSLPRVGGGSCLPVDSTAECGEGGYLRSHIRRPAVGLGAQGLDGRAGFAVYLGAGGGEVVVTVHRLVGITRALDDRAAPFGRVHRGELALDLLARIAAHELSAREAKTRTREEARRDEAAAENLGPLIHDALPFFGTPLHCRAGIYNKKS